MTLALALMLKPGTLLMKASVLLINASVLVLALVRAWLINASILAAGAALWVEKRLFVSGEKQGGTNNPLGVSYQFFVPVNVVLTLALVVFVLGLGTWACRWHLLLSLALAEKSASSAYVGSLGLLCLLPLLPLASVCWRGANFCPLSAFSLQKEDLFRTNL